MLSKVKNVIDILDARIKSEQEKMQAETDFNPDNYALAAGPHSAGLLAQLVRVMSAKCIVEVGTSIGYTALWLGEAAMDTGGRVIGLEAVEKKYGQAMDNIALAGLSEVIEMKFGDAKQLLSEIQGPIDLAFIDAWKSDYCFYFDELLPKVRVGGCIVADNITFPESVRQLMQEYQVYVGSKNNVRTHYVGIGSGLEMSVKIAV